MIIKNNSKVSLLLTIKDGDGLLLEANESLAPLTFIQGSGSLLPAVEEALYGKTAGDEIRLILPPEKAFGYKNEALKKKMPLHEFIDSENAVQVGDAFILHDDNPLSWVVTSVADEQVYLDANNAWAGKTLHIWIKIIAVAEEMRPGKNLIFFKQNTETCGPGCVC